MTLTRGSCQVLTAPRQHHAPLHAPALSRECLPLPTVYPCTALHLMMIRTPVSASSAAAIPVSQATCELHRLMASRGSVPAYRLVTGALDPIVRQPSATMAWLGDSSSGVSEHSDCAGMQRPWCKTYPHLQHYNIAVAGEVWRDVASWALEAGRVGAV